jgi:hypothetical protein
LIGEDFVASFSQHHKAEECSGHTPCFTSTKSMAAAAQENVRHNYLHILTATFGPQLSFTVHFASAFCRLDVVGRKAKRVRVVVAGYRSIPQPRIRENTSWLQLYRTLKGLLP